MREPPHSEAIVVVGMGGHAFMRPREPGTVEEHRANAARITGLLVALVERGYHLVVTHGNAPQVGNLLLQNELTRSEVPPWPLDVLVAQTEGSLGYLLQQAFQNHLRRRRLERFVVSLICQVLVDPADPAFREPTKPVGPFMSRAEAERRRRELGWVVAEDRARGWRRLVPSPRPREVLQWRMIRDAARSGHLVIACGGGGIPNVRGPQGDLVGVEAVVDKDLTSSILATQVGAEFLILLSDVPNVYVHYGTPAERALNAVTLEEAERYIGEGHFPAGSMGPKVTAIYEFLRGGGKRGLITSPEHLGTALEGRAGTHFVGKF